MLERSSIVKRPYPYPLKHGIYLARQYHSDSDVTVCIAAICSWNHAKKADPPNYGAAVLALSDRMITVDDTEYEPSQQKIGRLSASSWVLIAGDFTTHSQAIVDTRKQIGTNNASISDVATIYGKSLQKIKLSAAEDEILAPLGLNTDTFIAQQREMSPSLVDSLATQLQHHAGQHVEALIVGMDGIVGHLYHVDSKGTARCYDDVGFAAIGLGAWHARSQLMQSRYVNTMPFVPALALTYAAKKVAEVAPGVGKETDIQIISRTGIEPLLAATKKRAEELYEQYEKDRQSLSQSAIEKLRDFVVDPKSYESASSAKQPAVERPMPSSPTEPEPPPSQSVPGPQM